MLLRTPVGLYNYTQHPCTLTKSNWFFQNIHPNKNAWILKELLIFLAKASPTSLISHPSAWRGWWVRCFEVLSGYHNQNKGLLEIMKWLLLMEQPLVLECQDWLVKSGNIKMLDQSLGSNYLTTMTMEGLTSLAIRITESNIHLCWLWCVFPNIKLDLSITV